jgi:biotin synthase
MLNTLAVLRIVDPQNAKILVTTAFETIDPQAREKGLMAGANSLMLNVTPRRFRKSYYIYPHRAYEDNTVEEQIRRTLELLYRIGRAPTDLGVNR